MNTKKIIGLLCWLLAFFVPFQSALLNAEPGLGNNIPGLVSFVAFVVLVFAGYLFYDGASGKPQHGH